MRKLISKTRQRIKKKIKLKHMHYEMESSGTSEHQPTEEVAQNPTPKIRRRLSLKIILVSLFIVLAGAGVLSAVYWQSNTLITQKTEIAPDASTTNSTTTILGGTGMIIGSMAGPQGRSSGQNALTEIKVDYNKGFLTEAEVNSLVDWRDWYPLDFDIPEQQYGNNLRILTRIDGVASMVNYNQPDNLDGDDGFWPERYNGHLLNFVRRVPCKYPECENTTGIPLTGNHEVYTELTTQGSAFPDPTGRGRDVTLESWQRNRDTSPEIHIDIKKLTEAGGKCTSAFFTSEAARPILKDKNFRRPLIFAAPNTPNTYVINPPVCLIKFKHNNNFQWWEQVPEKVDPAMVYQFLVVGTNLKISKVNGREMLYVVNSYFSNSKFHNTHFNNEYCNKEANPMDKFHCTGDPNRKVTISIDGTDYYPHDIEEYEMQKTTSTGQYGSIRDNGHMARWRMTPAYIDPFRPGTTPPFMQGGLVLDYTTQFQGKQTGAITHIIQEYRNGKWIDQCKRPTRPAVANSCTPTGGISSNISWGAVTGAKQYAVVIDDDPNFWQSATAETGERVKVLNTTQTSITTTFATNLKRYYEVRVNASDVCAANQSAYSPVRVMDALGNCAAPTPTPTATPSPRPTPTPQVQANRLNIVAKGIYHNNAWPILEVLIKNSNGVVEKKKSISIDSTVYKTFTYDHPTNLDASQVRLRFVNDSGPRDAWVDYIKIGNNTYQTEDPTTYSTGTWNNNTHSCDAHYAQSEKLHCNGEFHFLKNRELLKSTRVNIIAKGTYHSNAWPILEVHIKNSRGVYEKKASITINSSAYKAFAYDHPAPFDASQVRLKFVNDNGPRDVWVQSIKFGTATYPSNAYGTYSTASYSNTTKLCSSGYLYNNPAYSSKEILACNGYFDYFKR